MNAYEVPFTKYNAHLLVFVKDDLIVTRTFGNCSQFQEESFVEATPQLLNKVLTEPSKENFVEIDPEKMNVKFKGKDIFPDFEGDGYVFFVCGYTFKMDETWFGKAGLSDRATILFTCDGNGVFRAPFNVAAYTYLTRQHRHALYGRETLNSFFMIIKPYADSTLEECTYFVKWNRGGGYKVRHPFTVIGERKPNEPSPQIFPKVVLEGPENVIATNEPITLNVKVVNGITGEIDTRCNSTLYIEMVSGYAPITRVNVVNGKGSFRVIPLAMNSGEELKVKIGWRLWPGAAEYKTILT